VCDPTYRARYRDALTAEVRAVQATGARFVMTTEVYDRSYASGSDAAVDCDNPIRRSVADATGAQLVDMNAFICPNGECRTSQNGVLLRVDGTHYKGAGARIVARWIMHQISAPIPSA
jgi:lysophospholipase L1-like esterase